MPRPRKVVASPALTSGQAAFVIERFAQGPACVIERSGWLPCGDGGRDPGLGDAAGCPQECRWHDTWRANRSPRGRPVPGGEVPHLLERQPPLADGCRL